MAVMAIDVKGSGERVYKVRKAGDVWTCTCDDHVYRSHGNPYSCKHIAMVTASLFAFSATAQHSDASKTILDINGARR